MFVNTQVTVPDEEHDDQTQPNTRVLSPSIAANTQSSEYEGGSSFEQHLAQSFDANGLLKGIEISETQVEKELSQDLTEFALNQPEVTALDAAKEVLIDRLNGVFRKIVQYIDHV